MSNSPERSVPTPSARPRPTRRPGLPLLLALLPGLLAPVLQAAEPLDLKPRWPVGQRLVSRLEADQSQRILGGPTGPMNQQVAQRHEIAVDVTRALPDGGHELVAQFLSLNFELKTGSITSLAYDSTDPSPIRSADPLHEAFDQLMKARPTLVLDPRGDILKVSGLDAMMQNLASGGGLTAALFQSAFTKDAWKQMVGVPQGLPAKPVRVGDRWPYETEIALGPLGAMRLSMFFTFRGLETRNDRQCALLEYTGSIFGKPAPAGSPLSVTITGGSLKGKTWFDPAAGLLVETSDEQNLTLRMAVLGQQMTLISNQKSTQTLLRVEPIPAP